MGEKNKKREQFFSEKEIGVLIKRATEIQGKDRELPDRSLSLQEIEHIAEEIGINPEHLRTAVAEMGKIGQDYGPISFLGGPFSFERQSIVKGEVDEELWEDIVRYMRLFTGSYGTTGSLGRAREWTRVVKDLSTTMERTQLTLGTRDDRTVINVRKQYGGAARMAYVLGFILGGFCTGVFLDGSSLSDLAALTIAVGGSVAGLTVVRLGIAVWGRRQRQRIGELMDWLYDTISASASRPETKSDIDSNSRPPP